MYSVTFALTAIFGIVLTNLFLGFAFAVLIGRGPKSWSDVESAVTIRYFSPRLLFPFTRRTAKKKTKVSPAAASAATSTPVAKSPPNAKAEAPTPTATSTGLVQPIKAVQPIAMGGTTPRLVLPPKPSSPSDEQEQPPPEVILARQLEAWQSSDPREEIPCLSGFVVSVPDNTVDDRVRSLLMNAVLAKIVSQLRKDRQVLRTDENHFVWFSADIHPDDGLMPVGRIGQIIDKTQFLHQDSPLAIETRAVVMAVTPHDNAADLIQRMQVTLKHAQENGGRSMCIDLGEGPAFVEPLRMEIDESECVLT